MMFQLYVTDLDKFQYHQTSEQTDAELLDSLEAGPPASAMRRIVFGSYVHALIEYRVAPTRSSLEEVQCAQTQLHMWHDKECRNEIADMPYEVPDLPPVDACELQARLTVPTDHGLVLLRGRIDAIHGSIAYDWKISGNPQISRYAESMQHHAYFAAMPELRTFRYYLFKASIPGLNAKRPVYGLEPWGYYQIERQPDELGKVQSVVRDFRAMAHKSGWRGRPVREN